MDNEKIFTGYNPTLKELARNLRKNMTKQEKRLWYEFLKDYPITINRQRPIECYIVDFFCYEAKLVIEIDGSQHFTKDGLISDKIRTEVLELYDLEVIRFSNHEVDTMFELVCDEIDRKIRSRAELIHR